MVFSKNRNYSCSKKLFFNLRRAKNQIQAYEVGDLNPENLEKISKQLNVPEKVVNMNRRLSGADPSLNAKISSDDGSQTEWQDWIEADTPNQEEEYAEKEEDSIRKDLISESLSVLNEKSWILFKQDVLVKRQQL